MANASYEVLEVRFRIQPDWTVVHVLHSQASDGTLGVGGWHTKRFPPTVPVDEILARMYGTDGQPPDAPVLWPQEAPEET